LEKLQKNLGGIRGMNKRPDAVFILDTKKEHIAVTEANKLGIPIIAVVDTNVDPDVIQFPIPGNDDAIRANALMSRVIAEAIEEGRYISSKRNPQAAPKRSVEEDAEFMAAQADARKQAASAQAEREARLAAAKTDPTADEAALDGAAPVDAAPVDEASVDEASVEEAPADAADAMPEMPATDSPDAPTTSSES
ncbi:MAG: 30S ribosomal protein S2, partial [Ilumatobacteraceae bacterium]